MASAFASSSRVTISAVRRTERVQVRPAPLDEVVAGVHVERRETLELEVDDGVAEDRQRGATHERRGIGDVARDTIEPERPRQRQGVYGEVAVHLGAGDRAPNGVERLVSAVPRELGDRDVAQVPLLVLEQGEALLEPEARRAARLIHRGAALPCVRRGRLARPQDHQVVVGAIRPVVARAVHVPHEDARAMRNGRDLNRPGAPRVARQLADGEPPRGAGQPRVDHARPEVEVEGGLVLGDPNRHRDASIGARREDGEQPLGDADVHDVPGVRPAGERPEGALVLERELVFVNIDEREQLRGHEPPPDRPAVRVRESTRRGAGSSPATSARARAGTRRGARSRTTKTSSTASRWKAAPRTTGPAPTPRQGSSSTRSSPAPPTRRAPRSDASDLQGLTTEIPEEPSQCPSVTVLSPVTPRRSGGLVRRRRPAWPTAGLGALRAHLHG